MPAGGIGPPRDVFTGLPPVAGTVGPPLDVFAEAGAGGGGGGTGTVTSIDVSGGTTGLTTTGGPVTNAGTITLHLLNAVQLSGRNAADNADVGIVGVDSSDRVTISSFITVDSTTQTMELTAQTASGGHGYTAYQYLNSNNGAKFWGLRARGTLASPLAVASTDSTIVLESSGYDGANFQNGALIRGAVDGVVSAGHVPQGIEFHTTDAGVETLAFKRMSISSAGNVVIQSADSGVSFKYAGFTMPDTDGNANDVLTTNGSKVLSFQPPSGGGSVTVAGAMNPAQVTSAADNVYQDLGGPAVTVTTGTTAVVWISCQATKGAPFNSAWLSLAVSGATTLAAIDDNSMQFAHVTTDLIGNLTRPLYLTGLTAGSNTFTLMYKDDGGFAAWSFFHRSIVVLAP